MRVKKAASESHFGIPIMRSHLQHPGALIADLPASIVKVP